jgi:hypothetical protein
MPVTKAEHEIVWTRAGKTIQVGLERHEVGPILVLLPALSSISTRSEMRPAALGLDLHDRVGRVARLRRPA